MEMSNAMLNVETFRDEQQPYVAGIPITNPDEEENNNQDIEASSRPYKMSNNWSRSKANNEETNNDLNRSRGHSVTDLLKLSVVFSTPKLPLLPLRKYLLFTGIEKPNTWYSPWWLTYIGWRLFVILSLLATVDNMISFHNKRQWLNTFYLIPASVATFTAGLSWFWLPRVLEGLESQKGPPIIDEDMSGAKKLFSIFFIFNFLSAIILASVKVSVSISYGLFGIIFLECCGATVILGGVLLVLTIETTLAKKEVQLLLEAAQECRLTRSMYMDSVKSIKLRQDRWRWPLNSLAFVACYCSMCLIYVQTIIYDNGKIETELFSSFDDDAIAGIEINLEIILVLMKEILLLFIIMYLIMGINDEADAITAELISSGPWGNSGLGSHQDGVRLDLLFISTTHVAPSPAVKSWYNYFTIDQVRPISFDVLYFRITRAYVLAVVFSFCLALINIVYKSLN